MTRIGLRGYPLTSGIVRGFSEGISSTPNSVKMFGQVETATLPASIDG